MPVPPIIAAEHGDVSVFRTLVEAEEYVEPVDVENDEYRFYDAEGLRLTGEVQTVREPGGWLHRLLRPPYEQTKLVAAPGAQHVPDELASLLRSYLSRIGVDRTGVQDEQIAQMSLDELIVAATKFQHS